MLLQEGQLAQVVEQYKDFPVGLVLRVKALRPAGTNATIAQCMDESGTFPGTLGIPANKLAPYSGGTVAAVLPDADDPFAGPVTDFFSARTPFDEVGLNFARAYINGETQANLQPLFDLLEARGIAQDRQWNELEVAQLYLDYLDTVCAEADPAAQAIVVKYTPGAVAPVVTAPPQAAPAPVLAPPTLAAPTAPTLPPPGVVAPPGAVAAVAAPPGVPPVPSPPAAPAAPAKPAKGKATGGIDATIAASAPTKSVDHATWDARRMQALRIQGQLAQFYAESPGTFQADLGLALSMLAKAADTKA